MKKTHDRPEHRQHLMLHIGLFQMIRYGPRFESSRSCNSNLELISRPDGEQGIWVGLNGESSSTSVDWNDDE